MFYPQQIKVFIKTNLIKIHPILTKQNQNPKLCRKNLQLAVYLNGKCLGLILFMQFLLFYNNGCKSPGKLSKTCRGDYF